MGGIKGESVLHEGIGLMVFFLKNLTTTIVEQYTCEFIDKFNVSLTSDATDYSRKMKVAQGHR